eukprot:TRINITY_DN3717_c0_g1_i1.p1 TRINITY_DN3717_c0_g1~~TRINITY_DN3717_c0_g1_i1.p1  ORF type:complete len:314 (+),score=46.61 TRINITY_DN3717_c0_g1_i1:68-1009(+)
MGVGEGPGVPPSSTMPWLLVNASIPGVVISDFSSEYSTPNFRSYLDQPDNVSVALTTAAVSVGVQVLHKIAGGIGAPDIDNSTMTEVVEDLYQCFFQRFGCHIASQLMTPNPQRSWVETTVLELRSVTKDDDNQDINIKRNIERFVYNFLANRTGVDPKETETVRCDPTSEGQICPPGSVCVGWRFGSDVSEEEGKGRCINASVAFVPSWSPKFVCNGCNGDNTIDQFRWEVVNQSYNDYIDGTFQSWGMPRDSMWTWSRENGVKSANYLEVYIKEDSSRSVSVLVGGLLVTIGCGGMVILAMITFEKYVKSQ